MKQSKIKNKILLFFRSFFTKFFPPKSVNYINGTETLPPPLSADEETKIRRDWPKVSIAWCSNWQLILNHEVLFSHWNQGKCFQEGWKSTTCQTQKYFLNKVKTEILLCKYISRKFKNELCRFMRFYCKDVTPINVRKCSCKDVCVTFKHISRNAFI